MDAKIEQFTLVSASLLKNGGVRMRHILEIPNDGVIDYIYGNEDITIEPDEDFSSNFDALKPVIARIYKFDSFKSILSSDEFGASKKQFEIAKKRYQDILDTIEIKGIKLIKWNTKDDKRFIIEAEYSNNYGHILKLNKKEIHLSSIVGIEKEIEKACEIISLEAFKYRYEGKRKQLEIPGFNGAEIEKTIPFKKEIIVV